MGVDHGTVGTLEKPREIGRRTQLLHYICGPFIAERRSSCPAFPVKIASTAPRIQLAHPSPFLSNTQPPSTASTPRCPVPTVQHLLSRRRWKCEVTSRTPTSPHRSPYSALPDAPRMPRARKRLVLFCSRPTDSTGAYQGQHLLSLPVHYGAVIDQHLRIGEGPWRNGHENTGAHYIQFFFDFVFSLCLRSLKGAPRRWEL